MSPNPTSPHPGCMATFRPFDSIANRSGKNVWIAKSPFPGPLRARKDADQPHDLGAGFPCEERGEIEVKGLHYPVRAYEMVEEASRGCSDA